MNVYLCLPAFNEEPSISPLFHRISIFNQKTDDRADQLRVIVFDDGSSDATVAEVEKWSSEIDITVIRGIKNQGLGIAVRNLLEHFLIISESEDVAVLMDCDDTHDPAQINEMTPLIGKYDVVIASRYRKGSATSGVPLHRLIVSFGFMLLAKTVLPIRGARDYSCGYRAYSRRIIESVRTKTDSKFVSETGFSAMPELLWNCAVAGAEVTEIPMKLGYDRKLSDSKMDVAANSKNLIKLLLKLRMSGRKPIEVDTSQ